MTVAAERAVDELKRGRAVVVEGERERLAVLAVELASDADLLAFEQEMRADLLITDKRAATLSLANQRAAAGMRAVRLVRPPWVDAAGAVAVADPVLDLREPMKGPFETVTMDDAEAAASALQAAKYAGLLPALFVRPAAAGEKLLSVRVADISAYRAADTLKELGRAKLPLKGAKDTRVAAFRSPGGPEHLALLIGAWAEKDAPLTRLHSACLTGDVLGSLKCDCGDQLRASIEAISADGGGIVLYLQQEGRGIGLMNKLRAYALQDQGFDTVDANLRLGFEVDERDFGIAASMLRQLGTERIRLLTNNPEKVGGLADEDIEVIERVPLIAGHGPLNEAYLRTKRDRTGHQL